jgi:hypothetical protein
MMNEYFLIGFRTTIGQRGYKFIDKVNTNTLSEARKEFERRNKFDKLLEKYDLNDC